MVIRRLAEYRGKTVLIDWEYGPTSKLMRGTDELKPVRFTDPDTGKTDRGWLTSDNRILTGESARDLLNALDSTAVGMLTGVSLLNVWDSMYRRGMRLSIRQVRLLEVIADIDWKEFWREYGSDSDVTRGWTSLDEQQEMYDRVVTRMFDALRLTKAEMEYWGAS